MADSKISALTSASTPLAGTEVLPIVQSGATVKVATDNLTVKNLRSNATTGILQVAGPAAASTRVMTTPDANFSVARTDAAQSFSGDQTLTSGNLVIGTSGKGIDFSAAGNAGGMTSELLNDYEEGTWTPTLEGYTTTGTGTYTTRVGTYTKIGRQVFITMTLTWTAHTGTGFMLITGLPFAVSAPAILSIQSWDVGYTALSFMTAQCDNGLGVPVIYPYSNPIGGGSYTTIDMDTAGSLKVTGSYYV